jgi:hypothetical protein
MDPNPPHAAGPNNLGAPRKGLHPLAWVGIGCGGLTLLALIAIGLLAWWGYHTASGIVDEFKNNEEYSTAEVVIAMTPDLEVVARDLAAKTLTVRHSSTGSQTDWSLEDIEAGRLTFTDAAGTLTQIGAPADSRPAWLPLHEPNHDARLICQQKDATHDRGALAFATSSSAEEITATYTAAAAAAGLTHTSNRSTGDSQTVSFTAISIAAEDHLGRSTTNHQSPSSALSSGIPVLTLQIRPHGGLNQVLLAYSIPTP